MKRFFKLLKDRKGASAVEYAVMVALIAAAIIGTVQILGQNVNTTFTAVSNALLGATP